MSNSSPRNTPKKQSAFKKATAFAIPPMLALSGVALAGITDNINPDLANAATSSTSSDIQVILSQTNALRAEVGLPPLVLNQSLSTVAQNWSQHQADYETQGHNPDFSSQIPSGWFSAGENVASVSNPDTVVAKWKASSGHYANMINADYTDIGIGIAYSNSGIPYYTQNFAGYYTTPVVSAAPVNPSSSAVTSNGATIAWNEPYGAGARTLTGYQLNITNTTTGTTTTKNVSADQTSAVLTDLRSGRPYRVTIQAVNSAGKSSLSTPTSFTTLLVAPTKPSKPESNVGPREATVSWTQDSNDTVASWTVTLNGQTQVVTSPTAHFAGLEPNKNYEGTIVATNSAGSSPATSFSVHTPPTASDPVSSVIASASNTQVDASWVAPAFTGGVGLSSYQVNLLDEGGNIVRHLNVDPTKTNTTFTGLERGKKYSVRVAPVNVAGVSSSTQSPTVKVPAIAPNTVNDVSLNLTDEKTLTATWAAPSYDGGAAISSYQVSVYNADTGKLILSKAVTGLELTVTADDGISANTKYRFEVSASNEAGSSSPTSSNTVQVPKDPTVSSSPSNVTTNDVTYKDFTVNWGEPEDNGGTKILSYKVRLLDAQGLLVEERQVSADEYSTTFEDLHPATSYTVEIRAENRIGVSGAQTTSVITKAVPPSAPQNVYLANVSNSPQYLAVSWNPPATNGGKEITSYTVVLTDANGKTYTKNISAGEPQSVVFTDLPYGTSFTATVTASNDDATSDAASSKTVSTPFAPVAPTKVTSTVDKTTVTAEWTGGEHADSYNVRLYDATGKLITKAITENTTYQFSGLAKNTQYYVTVSSVSFIESSVTTSNTVLTEPNDPTGVQNLTVSNLTPVGGQVSWAQPSDNGGSPINHYIYTVKNTQGIEVLSGTTEDTTITLTGLKNNTSYVVGVSAVSNAGKISPENTAALSTLIAPPSAVQSLNTSIVEDGGERSHKLVVNWSAPTDNGGADQPLSYRVNYLENGVLKDSKVTQSSSVSFSSVTHGASYLVQVTAYNSAGYSETETVTGQVPTIAPTNIQNVDVSDVTPTGAKISWTAPTDNGGADIIGYTYTVTDDRGTELVTGTTPNTNYVLTGLENNKGYVVSITANNAQHSSEPVETTVHTLVAPPAAVTGLSSSVVSSGDRSQDLNVSWDAVTDKGGSTKDVTYKVEYVLNGEVVKTNEVTTTHDTLSSVVNGASYSVIVTTLGEAGESSSVVKTVDIPAVTPDTVQNVNISDITPTSANVSWTAPTDNGGADITNYIYTLSDTEDNVIRTGETSSTHVSLTGLSNNSEYKISIIAKNSAGLFSKAAQNTVHTLVAPPAAVTGLSSSVVSSGDRSQDLNVSWNAVTDKGGSTKDVTYKVEYIVNGQVEDSTTTSNTSVTFSNIQNGANYYVSVTTFGEGGSSEPLLTSGTAPAVTPLNVENIHADNVTPTSANVSWTAPTDNGGANITSYLFSVTDSTGKEVKQGSTTSTAVGITDLAYNSAYTVTVKAVNQAGKVSEPDTVEFRTLVAPPAAVTGLSSSVVSSGDRSQDLNVAWNAVTDKGGSTKDVTYKVEYIVNGQVENSTTTSNTSVTFSNIQNGANYTVRVVTIGEAGESPVSTIQGSAPAVRATAPQNVVVNNVTPTSANVSWTAPADNGGAGITHYEVVLTPLTDAPAKPAGFLSLFATKTADGVITTVVDGGQTSVVIDELERDTAYSVSVRAVNSAGASDVTLSDDVIVTAPSALPEYDDSFLGKDVSTVDSSVNGNTLTGSSPLFNDSWVYGYVVDSHGDLVAHSSDWSLGKDGKVTLNFDKLSLQDGSYKTVFVNSANQVIAYSDFEVTTPVEPVVPGENTGNGNNSTDGENTTNSSGQSAEKVSGVTSDGKQVTSAPTTKTSKEKHLPPTGQDSQNVLFGGLLAMLGGLVLAISRKFRKNQQ